MLAIYEGPLAPGDYSNLFSLNGTSISKWLSMCSAVVRSGKCIWWADSWIPDVSCARSAQSWLVDGKQYTQTKIRHSSCLVHTCHGPIKTIRSCRVQAPLSEKQEPCIGSMPTHTSSASSGLRQPIRDLEHSGTVLKLSRVETPDAFSRDIQYPIECIRILLS